MADTPNGETVTPGDSQTDATTTSTPPVAPPTTDNASAAEVERLRKEAEQKELRIRQLENERKAREEKDEADRQKQLEEQNEWKTIAEQNKAKLDALEKEREEAVAKIELETKQSEVFKEFPEDVVELARDTGLTLSENSDGAVEALKAKLTKLSEKVSSQSRVTPNNQSSPASADSRTELLREHAKTQTMSPGNTPHYDKALSGLSWVKQARAMNGEKE